MKINSYKSEANINLKERAVKKNNNPLFIKQTPT